MQIDLKKLDEMILAILYINLCETGSAWKGMPWDSLDRLHQAGLISNPISKAKSVHLSEEAEKLAKAYWSEHTTENHSA